jgi:hypothetical protein
LEGGRRAATAKPLVIFLMRGTINHKEVVQRAATVSQPAILAYLVSKSSAPRNTPP